jgi:hypothetical protein
MSSMGTLGADENMSNFGEFLRYLALIGAAILGIAYDYNSLCGEREGL